MSATAGEEARRRGVGGALWLLAATLVFAAILVVVSGLLREAPTSWRIAELFVQMVCYPAATMALTWLIDQGLAGRGWVVRRGSAVTGAVLGFGVVARFGLPWDADAALGWTFLPFVVASGCAATFLYACVADFVSWLTSRASSLKRRFEVLGVITATFAIFVMLGIERIVGPAALPLAVVSVIGIAWGLAAIGSHRLTDRLTQAVEALDRLGQGELDHELPIQGRDEIAHVAVAFNGALKQLREKAFIERAFGRYASADVLHALQAEGGLDLAPTRITATVLFADIRGFTALSERAPPEEVLSVLNAYFERVVEIVQAHGGYLNKFIGDAVMVVFGAPGAQADHAARGIACARAMQDAVGEMNRVGLFGERTLAVGIGVNTGPLVAGSLGGVKRAEYTVIGDTVNVASRLTSAAKPGEVLVGEECAAASGLDGLTRLEPIHVKGKVEAVPVFRARELPVSPPVAKANP